MTKLGNLFILIFVLPYILYPQGSDIKFERISVEQGLSESVVRCILQDSKGFMWFGTEDGLNKYDGYKFTVYRNDPDDSTSLSDNDILDIYEDHSGSLWIATTVGGLDKFNREKEVFTHYLEDLNNPESISCNNVRKVDQFKYGNQNILWIGVCNGLNKFDFETEKFTRYLPTDQGIPYGLVETMVVDSSGVVWLVSYGWGLLRFDPATEKYTHYVNDPNNSNSLSDNFLLSIYADKSGILWIGTGSGGLNKLDPTTGQFARFRHDPNDPQSISDNRIISIHEDRTGDLWIGTWYEGLNRFDRETERFSRYKHDPHNPYSLNSNAIMSIYQDKSDVLWIGHWQGGLSKINPGKEQFTLPQLISNFPDDLNIAIWALYEDQSGVLWIGTWGKGLYKLNRKTGQLTSYQHDPNNPSSLSDNIITHITPSSHDGRDVLWIGTMRGLNKFDLNTEQFTHYLNDPDDPKSISDNTIRSILEDSEGILWLGTQTGGLNRFDPKTEQFTLVGSRMGILQVYEDKSDDLWIASWQGLKNLDRKTETFKTYRHNPDNHNSISNNHIVSLYEDKSGILWIGTAGGLNRFERDTDTFTRYSVKNGLPNDVINGILEDNKRNLWISTNKGISKFNPETGTIRNYDVRDGLRSIQYIPGVFIQNKKGEMFFGGLNGFDVFNPDNVKDNPHVPTVVITDFQIFNKTVKIKRENSAQGENDYFLPKNINTIEEIVLSYRESVFSFEFSTLDYHSPQKNRYAYKMEGVDPDWVYTDASRRFVTYTQLDPGIYIFWVKGSNNDGIWNDEGTSIKIIITPPWWRTNLAYAGYLLLFALTLYAVRTYDKKRQHLKHDLEFEHLRTEKLEEVDRMKSRFFANISHEFRTPLTLIKGPAKQIMTGDFNGSLKEKGKTILRNSDRLLSLINQILDLSKLDSGQMKLQVAQAEIIGLLKGLVLSFSSLAEQKKISLVFDSKVKSLVGYIDQDKFEKIVINLLSNAFNFTPEHGEISVVLKSVIPAKAGIQEGLISREFQSKNWIPHQVRDDNDSECRIPNAEFVQIIITNTGPAIPPAQMDNIFDRFFQADTSYKNEGEGSGIGLALTKELVELHHGTIGVECGRMEKQPPESPFSKGDLCRTTFTVSLPVGKNHLKEDEIAKINPESDSKNILVPEMKIEDPVASIPDKNANILSANRDQIIHDSTSIEKFPHPVTRIPNPVSRILIVEDNPEVIQYICSILEKDYRLISAENGKAGMDKALEKHPDIIISDVMMPEMDGLEFCQKVKSDERISHIPVILLTAKADLESKIEGLEFGADDYISKPFDAEELKIRIKNLLEQRQRLWRQYQKNNDFDLLKNRVASTDEVFLDRVRKVIDQHIDDPEFNVKKLSVELGISRRHLSRKFESLTGDTALIFIRRIRLARAVELLQQNGNNIVNISYDVGFTTPSYFAKCFRRQYGLNPSEYAAQYSKNGKIS